MRIQRCKMIIRLLALIAGGVVILTPKTSASRDTSLDDQLTGITAASAVGATNIPALWTAGGLSAGYDSAGQAARMASDAAGNVAVVSGPSNARDLAVTSYTAGGALRWRRTVTPSVGTFRGDWIVAAPNGDFVAVGSNVNSHGDPMALALVRYASDGTFRWQVDIVRWLPYVARLLVDSGGNSYLAFSSIGDGQDIQVHKYSPSGVLLWSQVISTGYFAQDVATSLALSPDEADVVVSGDIAGGATWLAAAYNASTGARKWLVAAPEGTAARDVVVDATRVYVTGQGVTDPNTPAMKYFLTVVAYDRATGARLWRTDKKPADGFDATGVWMAKAPDGSLVVTGYTNRGFLDWYTVAFETTGAVRWEAVRDGGLNTDEIPHGVLVMADGTTVVTGRGGPTLPGGFWPGVTAGYGPSGTLLWEAFSRMETIWVTALPNGDLCASGGYDAFITCFRVSGVVKAVMSATPSTGTAPLTVAFDGSASTTPSGTVTSWAWSFGDGTSGTGARTTHVYSVPGTYTVSLTVTDSNGASSTATGSIVANPLAPAAPSGLTASLSGYLVLLNWQDNSSNETLFYIERCAGVGCTNFANFVATQWPDAPSYTDYAVIAGQSYSYRVRAYNAGGYSPYSNIASIFAGVGNLSPTAAMSVAPATGTAPLSVAFDGSGSTDPDGTVTSWAWSFGDGASGSGVRTTHLYTTPGIYSASLTVTDNRGPSSSATAGLTIVVNAVSLPAPTNLTATALTRSSIGLKWKNGTTNQLWVGIERCQGSGCTNFTQIATVAGTAAAYTNTGLAANTTCRYRVRVHNSAGDSPYSNISAAKTLRR